MAGASGRDPRNSGARNADSSGAEGDYIYRERPPTIDSLAFSKEFGQSPRMKVAQKAPPYMLTREILVKRNTAPGAHLQFGHDFSRCASVSR